MAMLHEYTLSAQERQQHFAASGKQNMLFLAEMISDVYSIQINDTGIGFDTREELFNILPSRLSSISEISYRTIEVLSQGEAQPPSLLAEVNSYLGIRAAEKAAVTKRREEGFIDRLAYKFRLAVQPPLPSERLEQDVEGFTDRKSGRRLPYQDKILALGVCEGRIQPL